MATIGTIHFAASLVAIGLGAVVLWQGPKGGRRHRQFGWVYLVAMLTVNVTAFTLNRLFGGFGPFHAAAIASLVGIVGGIVSARGARRARLARQAFLRAHHIELHYWWMTFTYVGLIAALAAEAVTRSPTLRALVGGFGAAAGAATALVFAVGSYFIVKRRTRALAPFAPK